MWNSQPDISDSPNEVKSVIQPLLSLLKLLYTHTFSRFTIIGKPREQRQVYNTTMLEVKQKGKYENGEFRRLF